MLGTPLYPAYFLKNMKYIYIKTLFSICWAGTYLAMSLLGSLKVSPKAYYIEIGARLLWISLFISLFYLWNKQLVGKTIKQKAIHLYTTTRNFKLAALMVLNALWFIFIGIYHHSYVEAFSSAFTLLIVIGISVLINALRIIQFKSLLDGILLGTLPFIGITLYYYLTNSVDFFGIPFMFGFFDNPNGFGSAILTLLLASIIRIVGYRSSTLHKLLLWAYTCSLGYLIFLSNHRTAIIAILTGGVCSLVFSAKRSRLLIFGVISIVVISSFLLLSDEKLNSGFISPKWQRSHKAIQQIVKEGVNRETLRTLTSYRSDLWLQSLDVISEHPLLGTGVKTVGLRMFGAQTKNVSNDVRTYKPPAVRTAHNVFLHLGELYGIPAVLFFCAISFYGGRRALQYGKRRTLFVLVTCISYSLVNNGLMYSLQFISVFYLFTLCVDQKNEIIS
ncbi:MAG: hypothetical protein COB67_08735 [SAR324 cluster bacterium]|uniref:O-antigen ligase-related domain-containing protein n=1 Tax=SAR324 cluster bacterium TaxID=2024889 RepID=A0A2A4T2D7_9DELT|nr:MAG: hypothetical protein COB67_08735 [SAR324 cluster bacterium]